VLLQSNKPIGRLGEARQSGNTAFAASFNIDVKYTLQSLCPGHCCVALGWSLVWNVVRYSGFSAFASFGGRYPRSIFTVGGEDTVKTSQVDSRPGNQSDQPGDKVQRP